MKIDEIAKQYFEVKEPLQSKQTFRTNLGFYNNHILPVFSGSGIKTVHYVDYQKFANNLLAKDGKDLKPKTVKNILTVLVGIIDFAKKNEWYTGDNYASMVELPKYDNKYYITKLGVWR